MGAPGLDSSWAAPQAAVSKITGTGTGPKGVNLQGPVGVNLQFLNFSNARPILRGTFYSIFAINEKLERETHIS